VVEKQGYFCQLRFDQKWVLKITKSMGFIAYQPSEFEDSRQMCGWVIDD